MVEGCRCRPRSRIDRDRRETLEVEVERLDRWNHANIHHPRMDVLP